MKFYKKWPYWLKGGVAVIFWGSILELCLNFVIGINSNVNSIGYAYSVLFFIAAVIFAPGILIAFPLSQKCFLDGFFGSHGCPISQNSYGLIVLILNIIFYFAVGTFAGWLYGKNKNRNKISQV